MKRRSMLSGLAALMGGTTSAASKYSTAAFDIRKSGFFAFSRHSIGDLRSVSLSEIPGGALAFVVGQAKSDFGEGGIYIWNPQSYEQDDNLEVIAPEGLATGRWHRFISNISGLDFVKTADLASAAIGRGAALITYRRSNGTLRTVEGALSDALPHAFDKIPEAEHAAILAGTSTYDATADLQWLIDNYNGFRLPAGVVRVDPAVGLVVKHATRIQGFGMNLSIIYALHGGGTAAQLASYTKGSIIKRAFDPDGSNSYVQGVHLSDFAVVLNHPPDAITTAEKQIGFDLRNITRSFIERVFCGNYAPEGGPLMKARAGKFEYQGYGAVFGNPSGSASYAGGEANTIRDSHIWQVYRAVTIDDPALTPISAAYATVVDNCDIQGCHDAIGQWSQAGALNTFRNNVVQNIRRQPGNADDTHAYNLQGYNSTAWSGYIEAGSDVDYLVRLGPQSQGNYVYLGGYSSTNQAAIDVLDDGDSNVIDHAEQTGGEVSGRGRRVRTTNGARNMVKAKFGWDGAAIAIDNQIGVGSIIRNSVGDYTLLFGQDMPSANYDIQITLDPDESGIPGLVSISSGSVSASSCRFFTYKQSGGITSQIDPRKIWIRIEQ